MNVPVFTYSGPSSGTHLLILGAVHGDEVCGTVAASRLRLELDVKLLTIKSGQLTLAPLCNPLAYSAGRRFISANLNRIIGRYQRPRHEEEAFADSIAHLIESADVILDLHSYSAGTKPFLFLDDVSPEAQALAVAQQIPNWITGWPELAVKEQDINKPSDIDTIAFARLHGKRGIVVECGQHNDPAAIAIAYQCIRNTSNHLGLIASSEDRPTITPEISHVDRIIRRNRAGSFSRDWQHLDHVAAGQVIATYEDGEAISAPYDGIIILPHGSAEVGHEWFYFGKHL